ncbi:MAG TPA: hypothetical protein VHB99_03555 [Pirellulales bacterium]|nr:hypothetical protein [Pirellulales bacterium]
MSLTWQDDRWHCDGRGIHAGEMMELQGYDGKWSLVRVESSDRGRRLIAIVDVRGRQFACGIEPECDQLRWP